MRIPIANQGEVRIDRISKIPDGVEVKAFAEKIGADFLISHSESGNHHLLSGDVDVMQRVDIPDILYAIVRSPAKLYQDAADPHKTVDLDRVSEDEPTIYELGKKREYDPFTEQVRRVAD